MQRMNRWVIAAAGIFLQVALGAVYAWSVFRIPLARQFGWSISEVTLTFTISIFVLGIAAFFGGLWLNRRGPRIVALTGGVLYRVGVLGRVFWAWASDAITRKATFFVMFLVQPLLFWFLPSISSAGLLTVVAFIILLCYGGGFGTMPAFAADYFGAKNVGPIYGLMLTAWGFASAFGPLLIGYMRQANGTYRGALHIIAGVMLVSAVLPVLVSPPHEARLDSSSRMRESQYSKNAGAGSPRPAD
jgi:MFS family permease